MKYVWVYNNVNTAHDAKPSLRNSVLHVLCGSGLEGKEYTGSVMCGV